jgi:hypothetical protein
LLATQNAVKNVIILPANFDVTTYVDCFNDLKSIKVDSLEKCLKQLSLREKLLFAFSQRGLMMIQLLQFYKFRRKQSVRTGVTFWLSSI